MEDLIIKDEEFTDYNSTLENIRDSIEGELQKLINILTEVCNDVVTDGNFHTNLEAFVAKMANMKDNLFYVTEVVNNISTDLISDIDEIDETIY